MVGLPFPYLGGGSTPVTGYPLCEFLTLTSAHTNTPLPLHENIPASGGRSGKAQIFPLSFFLTSFTSQFMTISDKHHILASTSNSGQVKESISWKLVLSIIPGSP